MIEWKPYEEVDFNDKYILRWVREGDEYVNRISKEMMADFKATVEPQYRELSDEEINQIVWQQNLLLRNDDLRKFARAILKKASEK